MSLIEDEIEVELASLLRVHFLYRGKAFVRTALTCSFVVVGLASGRNVVAVQIEYDPKRQKPQQMYVCLQYKRLLIPPAALRRVSTYLDE